jgi:sarcosine oxidase, subunit gamma
MMRANANMVLTDLSTRSRFGVKGPNASKWLSAQGFALPEQPNSWVATADAMLLRLGMNEFLIEASNNHFHIDALTAAMQSAGAGVYAVPRADAAFQISGDAVTDLLSEICMLDTTKLNINSLLMTQVAGISAILLKLPNTQETSYRIWCDGSYHHYMHDTLSTIAKELGHVEQLVGVKSL